MYTKNERGFIKKIWIEFSKNVFTYITFKMSIIIGNSLF